jgi:hypothetical protein
MEQINKPYTKIGRLKSTIAKEAHIKCADIYISDNQIKHIKARHKTELEQLGITAELYIKMVVENFNEIRKGSGDSILLVVYQDTESKHHTAAVSLNYSIKEGFWEIKTAQPRKTEDILKREKIW